MSPPVMRDRTPPSLRRPIAHLAHALRPYLSDPRPEGRGATGLALEVARNCAACVELYDIAVVLEAALVHRVKHRWLAVGDLASAVGLGAAAWRRALEMGGRKEAA